MPLHSRAADAGLRQHAANGVHRGVPPVLGTLLGPQRPRHRHVFVKRRCSRRGQRRARPPAARACRPVPISMPKIHTGICSKSQRSRRGRMMLD